MVKKSPGPTDAMNGSGKRQATAPYTRGGMNKAQNGTRSSFQTDTSISAGGRLGGARELQRWDAGGPSSNGLGDGGLEDPSDSKQPWDQFAANKAKFGVETDYDENIYTTSIDRSRPDYKERLARADQLARRIESSAPASAHTAEERVMDHAAGPDDGQDEEDKYSGVARTSEFPPLAGGSANVYTPPARRAPTGQATVKGAPVDPAIISSQLRGGFMDKPTSKPDDVSSTVAKATSSDALPPAAKVADSATKDEVKTVESADKKESIAALKEFNKTMQDKGVAAPVKGIETQVAKAFKDFAQKERVSVREKAHDAKQKKLKELMSFANTFKLGTPVPNDLIGIIAKDPKKQLEIQEKAKKNAEEVQRTKELVAKKTEAIVKDAAPAAAKPSSSSTKPSETTTAAPSAAAISAPDTRAAGRGAALPPHVNAAMTGPNRHPGGNRQSYAPGQYQQQYRGDRAPGQNLPRHSQQPGHMAQHLRNTEQQRMAQAPLRNPDMRVPPTGPANAMPPPAAFLPRHPGMTPMAPPRLNPSSIEFKPNAPSFVPTGPSAASSPRSTLNHIAPAMTPPVSLPQPAPKFRKVRSIDVAVCNALSGVKSMQPPTEAARKSAWDENGQRPPYDTPITWKVFERVEEGKVSWKDQFERPPVPSVMATPTNVPAVPQQMAHQHQLPLYMQQGAQIAGPRQSPHIPPIPMHGGHPGHAQHMPFNGDDGARMMHPNPSQQSFASPRPGQAPTAFAPPNMMNSPHMQYSQPVMPGYMPGPAGPQMGTPQMRYQNPQYMPQQHGQMAPPMMMGHQGYNMAGPQHMMQGGPQMQQMGYPNPNFVPGGPVPPQAMQGANGYPSPGRPAAPMMAHQGSQQGHIYGMSPGGMPFQQPQFQPQQPGQMGNMRVNSNPGPQQGHQYGSQQNRGNGYGGKNFAGPHQGPSPTPSGPGGPQARVSETQEESK